MKSIIKSKSSDIKYPILGCYPKSVYPDRVILFTNKTTGTVITNSGPSDQPIGFYTHHWADDWVPFKGSIELTND